MGRPIAACRDRRPSWYLSFEMVCLILMASFVSGTFSGIYIATLVKP